MSTRGRRSPARTPRELKWLGPTTPYRPTHRGPTVTARISTGPPAPRRAAVTDLPAPSASAQGPCPRAWASGPGLIVLATFLQLAPKFIVSNALLVDGRADAELVMRKGLAAALVVSLGGEMVWTAFRPRGVPLRWAGALLLLSTAAGALHTALAYAGMQLYGPSSAFWLQAVAGCLTIPANQCTALWRLGQNRSPAKWRMVGWILSVGLGTIALLLPAAAGAMPTLILYSTFPLQDASMIALLMLSWD